MLQVLSLHCFLCLKLVYLFSEYHKLLSTVLLGWFEKIIGVSDSLSLSLAAVFHDINSLGKFNLLKCSYFEEDPVLFAKWFNVEAFLFGWVQDLQWYKSLYFFHSFYLNYTFRSWYFEIILLLLLLLLLSGTCNIYYMT